MDDSSIMPFGKFKGRRMDKVPDWYLLGIERNHEGMGDYCEARFPEVMEYVKDNMDVILKST